MAQLMSIKKNVDVQPGVGVPAIFHCSQGDKGTRIILGLLNNNDSYTIPEGTTAIIRGSRADGTLFTEITADIDTTTEIKFNLTEDMTSVAGPVECEAVMTSGSANIIGTANFIIDVEKSPASIGSVFPGTDAATTWLIDKLENEPLNSLNGESVVDAINGASGSGLTEDVKVALLACFEKVAWIDEDGQDYYDALYDALYYTTWSITYNLNHCASSNTSQSITKGNSYSATITPSTGYVMTGATVSITMGGVDITNAVYNNGIIFIPSVTGALVITITAVAKTVNSISAVFTQGTNVIYTDDALDSLKQYLVVTALYSDSSSEIIPSTDYTLSGTLTEGTQTITASFSGKTDTFNVVCTVKGWLYHFNESLISSGEDDFDFVGTGVYDDGLFNRKCYKHFTPTSGTASTDTQYGLYAKNLTKILDYGHDFTLSCWMATQANKYCHMYDQTKPEGNTYPSNHYISNATKIDTSWGNISNNNSTNNAAGLLVHMGTLSGNSVIGLRISNSDLTAASYLCIVIPNTVDTREWHHYAFTRKGDILRFFFDGGLVYEATASYSTVRNSEQVAISTNFNASTNNIQQMPNGEKLQDLYLAPFCKWESSFDAYEIIY